MIVLNSSLLKAGEARYEFFPIDRRRVRRFATQIAQEPPLGLPRIQYASPGRADLLGAGEAIKQLKEFILGVTDRVLDRRNRNLDVEERELAIAKLREELQHQKDQQRIQLLQKELDVVQKAEEVRALELKNIAKEIAFANSIEKAFRKNRLDSDQQANSVRWISSRSHPLLDLIDRGKLKGVSPDAENRDTE